MLPLVARVLKGAERSTAHSSHTDRECSVIEKKNEYMDSLVRAIKMHLATQFENDLFDAAIANLNDTGNVLRLNNFAYAMRELTRHFLYRLAPDAEVLQAPWFKSEIPEKPKEVTRAQRIRYAIQGWIKDEYATDVLKLNVKEISKNLISSIRDLSKYTHIEQKTFNVGGEELDEISFNILQDSLRFFMEVEEAKVRVFRKICDYIDEEMLSQFYIETQEPLDMIATHYEIESYIVTSITQKGKDDSNIFMEASGFVNARLQYGSDGDLRRDEGYEMRMEFPFTSSFVASYKNQEGDVHLYDVQMNIDNNSFYE